MKWFLLSLIILLSACSASTSVAVSPSPGDLNASPDQPDNLALTSLPTVEVTSEPAATPSNHATPTDFLATGRSASGAVEVYQIGEPVTFLVDEAVYVCQYFYDESPYAIIQITATGERELALRHSCIGFIGQGVDEYCEEGAIKSVAVEVGQCSDDVACGVLTIKETFTWDQQEFVSVTEKCAGKTIRREIKQQVPAGEYKIVVRLQQNDDEIVTRMIKEFTITK